MKADRFFKVIITVLVLVNIATLAFLWMGGAGNNRQQDGRGHHGGTVASYLTQQLSLSPQQQDAYKEMRDRHRPAVDSIGNRAAGYRTRLTVLLKQKHTDTAQVKALADSVGICQSRAELVTYYHLQEVRNMCSPRQQQHFDEIIGEAVHSLPHAARRN